MLYVSFQSLRNLLSCKQSRVVQRASGERSYHVFYQLCAGAPLFLKGSRTFLYASPCFYLGVWGGAAFHYLNVVIRSKTKKRKDICLLAFCGFSISFHLVII